MSLPRILHLSTSSPTAQPIKILLLENVHDVAVQMFKSEGFEVQTAALIPEEELLQRIPTVHAIGVRSRTKLTTEVLNAAKHLLCVGCFCIGTDQTDLQTATEKGIPVFNAPFANSRSVAELVISEIIQLSRQCGDRNKEMHSGVWKKISKGCHEVRGQTLGIVGYGHVGSQLSVLAEALGMSVIFYDIVPKLAIGNAKSMGSLDDLLAHSDFVSLHVPGGDSTANIINPSNVPKFKKGAYLINASRGTVVDVEAVAGALKSGHLGGAAFDVFPVEPMGSTGSFESVLQGCPNTLLTPHIGGSTEEAQEAIGREVAEKMINLINFGGTHGAVQFPEIQVSPRLKAGNTRIVNFHRNVPGVLRDISDIVGSSEVNVSFQSLVTQGAFGYMVLDIEADTPLEVKDKLANLKNSIRTRLLHLAAN